MHDDVREGAAPEAVARREEAPALVRRDPVEAPAQPGLERHVLPGLQQERVEEEHAELSVARPRLAPAQLLERADVDEDRLGAPELHVVRGGVLEDHSRLDRAAHERELEQRRVAEHRERPLVGVGDERDHVVLEHARDPTVDCVRNLGDVVDLARADEASVLLELLEEGRRRERPPVGEPLLAQEPEDPAVAREDAAVGIAERPRLETRERACRLQVIPPRRQLGVLSSSAGAGFPM